MSSTAVTLESQSHHRGLWAITPWIVSLFASAIGVAVHWHALTWQAPWVIIADSTIILLLFLFLWNRRFSPLESLLPASLTLLGLSLSATSILLPIPWFTVAGLALVIAGFLFAQRSNAPSPSEDELEDDPADETLGKLSWLLVPIVGIPASVHARLIESAATSMVASVDSILRFVRIPHVVLERSIELSAQNVQLTEITALPWNWQTFVSLAAIYSILMGRVWAVTLGNVLVSVFWWFAFHVGCMLLQCVFLNQGTIVAPLAIYLVCGILCCVLFLSTERGLRGLLAPVADGSGDSTQANPLIFAWNRLSNTGQTLLTNNQETQVEQKNVAWLSTALLVLASITATGHAANALGLVRFYDVASPSADLGSTTLPES